MAFPTLPYLTLPQRGNPSKFFDETYPAKTRGMYNVVTVWWKVHDPVFNRF